MNADLLAMLGSVPGVSSRRENEPKALLSFKCGKLIAERQPNGKYMVTADPRRGTLEVNWTASSSSNSSSSAGVLKLEWKDRRTRAVVDSLTVFPEDDCTYSKVDTGTGREADRVYLLQYGNASDRRFFFWMQEKEEGHADEDHCFQINNFMADPEAAAAVANGETKEKKEEDDDDTKKGHGTKASDVNASGALDSNALQAIMQGLNTSAAAAEGSNAAASPAQVDALSNILGNLGMPQTNANVVITPTATPSAAGAAGSGGLTLSDLQGAMAGLATTSPSSAFGSQSQQQPGPPLSEIVTSENILESGILENEQVKAKLIELLPDDQRSEERLLENLRSPQVKQCLKSLSAALCDDDGGSMDSFNSILANFQLRPEDGAIAMMAGNPIQAFLDCVLKSVQRETDEQEKTDEDNDGDGDGDTAMKE